MNKLRQLKGEEPNVLLPNDEYIEGLVSVKPMSAPSGNLFYMNMSESKEEKRLRLKKEKKEKRRKKLEHLNNLIRVDKIKYITEILKNN